MVLLWAELGEVKVRVHTPDLGPPLATAPSSWPGSGFAGFCLFCVSPHCVLSRPKHSGCADWQHLAQHRVTLAATA